MDVNTAYLIQCAIYEKCVNRETTGNYLAEFYRVHPDVFCESVMITPEIELLDEKREEVVHALEVMYDRGIEADDQRYADTMQVGWALYHSEIEEFCEINKTKLDSLIEQYRTYVAHIPGQIPE